MTTHLWLAAWALLPSNGTSPCRLLSLSGGGSWGAFEAGVLQRLIEDRGARLDYDRLLGVSAGAINAAYIATHPQGHAGLAEAVAKLRALWARTRTRDVWRVAPLDPVLARSLVSTEPLQRMVRTELSSRRLLRNITLGATSLATGKAAVFTEADLPPSLHAVVLASSAIPVLFPPVEHRGELLVDGGVVANVLTVHGLASCPPGAPVELDVVLAMPLVPSVAPARTRDYSLLDVAVRTAQVALWGAMDGQLGYRCPPGKRSDVLARVYAPGRDLTAVRNVLDFDGGEALWEEGYSRSQIEEYYFCV